MDICTVSKLANEAGVSVYVARDYVLRGLLRPARRTESGYGLYDDQALERLRFVRSLFEAGVGLDELTRLCHALDDGGSDAAEFLERVRARIAARCAALSTLDGPLEQMISAVRSRCDMTNEHAKTC